MKYYCNDCHEPMNYDEIWSHYTCGKAGHKVITEESIVKLKQFNKEDYR